ncbi:hypothetical protein J6590_076309 [Homalodisca vitripennis]|nr:hypothetical protein J6590_076309 [Homalodisca vitripennis]
MSKGTIDAFFTPRSVKRQGHSYSPGSFNGDIATNAELVELPPRAQWMEELKLIILTDHHISDFLSNLKRKYKGGTTAPRTSRPDRSVDPRRHSANNMEQQTLSRIVVEEALPIIDLTGEE